MKAMILSAGVGSRLFPLTDKLPKPMLPLANKPALEYLVDLCAKNEIKDIRMNLHYLPEEIDTYFQDGKKWNVNISYSLEKNLLGTAGAVKRSENYLDDTFVVLSGDGFTNINLSAMLHFHKKSGAKVTIAVKKVEDPSKFGVVVSDAEGRIQEFQEKPQKEEAKSDLVNLGIYIIEPEILKLIPKNESYDFGYQLFPKLLEMQIPFFSFETNEYWTDIGDIQEYWKLNLNLVSNRVKGFTNRGYKKHTKGILIGEGSKISKPSLNNSNGPLVIGKNCRIEDDVTISGPVVIGDNVTVEKGSVIMDSVILSNTHVGKNVYVANSVTSENYTMSIPHNFGMVIDDEKMFRTVSNETRGQKLSRMFIRLFDRAVALAALTALSPLFLIIAILIKLDSKGPVFYRSKRIVSPTIKKSGKNWNFFRGEKGLGYTVFRTMYAEADKRIGNLKNKYEGGPFVKVENDPRVTKIGRILRKTSIDELPLFINVLKGDMSLVGIWALPTYEAESLLVNGLKTSIGSEEIDFTEMAQVRFNGRAGLAGYWQSRGRSQLSAEERALHDSFQAVQYRFGRKYKSALGEYSKHLSIKGYFGMIHETFLSVIKRTGAI
jgi:NDP-sugar pyrophosphorylase family protein